MNFLRLDRMNKNKCNEGFKTTATFDELQNTDEICE